MKTTVLFTSYRSAYKLIRNWFIGLFIFFQIFIPASAISQCTSYTVNWDYLDFFHTSAGSWYNVTPPGGTSTFVTTTMKQSQNFALGPRNMVTFATAMNVGGSSPSWGDVTTHGGDVPGYTGADIHFVPTNGQTIVLTFLNPVSSASFTLYDLDRGSNYSVTAADAGGSPITVNATTYATSGTSIVGVSGSPGKTLAVAGTTVLTPPDNRGTVTISVTVPVKTITITATAVGTNAEFWFSDIIACTTPTAFTPNYHQTYTTPYTNQPAYFLVNPDFNLNVYMVDPINRTADVVFTDPGTIWGAAPAGVALNSLAYDPVNHYLYYVMNGATVPSQWQNRSLKRYDFTTNTITTIINNINTLGVPTFTQGVEAAGAAFYDTSLYLGIEGLEVSGLGTNTESVIWRIDFDASTGAALRASQVFGIPGDGGGQPSHDWGDFVIRNGIVYSHGSTLISPSYQSGFVHYNLTTAATATSYSGYADTSGQLGQLYNGTIYRLDNRIMLYNENGTTGAANTVSVTSCSPSWNNRPVNDISDPFRPALDFGDAPSTYDPNASSPAANQQACNNSTLRIGSVWDREWVLGTSTDASGDGGDEDGITTVSVMVSDGFAYNHVQEVVVLNNTGADAYLGGWLDYNANGVFEASEGVVVTVPSSASPQTISLGWTGITVAPGTLNSFIRVRLSSTALTTSSATGWLSDGETEDYPVISQAMPLSIQLLDFNATLTRDKNVLLRWKAFADQDALGFEVEKSQDQNTWTKIGWVNLNSHSFTADYSLVDQQPSMGKTYYRLKMVEKSGSSRYSNTRLIVINELLTNVRIFPNPAKNEATVTFNSKTNQSATILVKSLSGNVIMKRPFVMSTGVNSTQFSTSNLSNGLYIVEVVTNERSYINRLTVSH